MRRGGLIQQDSHQGKFKNTRKRTGARKRTVMRRGGFRFIRNYTKGNSRTPRKGPTQRRKPIPKKVIAPRRGPSQTLEKKGGGSIH
jgi:hypothetical protein